MPKPKPTASQMLLVENRVCTFDSHCKLSRPAPNHPFEYRFHDEFFLDPGSTVTARLRSEPNNTLTADGRPQVLELTFSDGAIQELSKDLKRSLKEQDDDSVPTGWRLFGIKLLVYEFGQLNVRTAFSAMHLTKQHAQSAEDAGMKLSLWITALQTRLFGRLIDTALVRLDARHVPGLYRWGVPSFLMRQGMKQQEIPSYRHSPEDGYTFTQHLFLHGAMGSMAKDLSKTFRLDNEAVTLENLNGSIGWTVRAWNTPQAVKPDLEMLDPALDLDALYLMELNVPATATSAYKATLGFLGTSTVSGLKKAPKGDELRRLVNLVNAQMLVLRFRERELTEEQGNALSSMQRIGNLENIRETYRGAEEAVVMAVEGLESSRIERATHIIEIAVLVFGALTVFSVLKDFIDLAHVRETEPKLSELVKLVAAPLSQVSLLLIGMTAALTAVVGYLVVKSRR